MGVTWYCTYYVRKRLASIIGYRWPGSEIIDFFNKQYAGAYPDSVSLHV